MKKILVPAALLMLVLTGCASKTQKVPVAETTTTVTTQSTSTDVQIDGKKEVAYLCGTGSIKNPLRVMYGFQGQNVVAAQVNYQGALSPVMMRDVNDVSYNTFVSPEGISWQAALATKDTVDKVGAIRLVQPSKQNVNGKEQIIGQVVTQNCVIDDGSKATPNKKVQTTKTVTTKKVYKRK